MERAETEFLEELIKTEDLAGKKARIYSRLLIEPALASEMENRAKRHETRRAYLQQLLCGKSKKQVGMSALNREKTEK